MNQYILMEKMFKLNFANQIYFLHEMNLKYLRFFVLNFADIW